MFSLLENSEGLFTCQFSISAVTSGGKLQSEFCPRGGEGGAEISAQNVFLYVPSKNSDCEKFSTHSGHITAVTF